MSSIRPRTAKCRSCAIAARVEFCDVCERGMDRQGSPGWTRLQVRETIPVSDFADLFSRRGHSLVLPESDEDQINRYVAMHSSDRASVERRPFRRQVDFWAFSIVAALAWDLEPRDGPPSSWGKRSSSIPTKAIMNNDLCFTPCRSRGCEARPRRPGGG